MATKQARKVALINIHDYKEHSAYYELRVVEPENPLKDGFMWGGRIYARKEFVTIPVLDSEGKPVMITVPNPSNPEENLKDGDGNDLLTPAFTRMCKQVEDIIGAVVPSDIPGHEKMEPADLVGAMKDKADTLAQTWALEQMSKYALKLNPKSTNPEAGHAMVSFITGSWILEALFEGLRRLFGPLIFALAYATTTRNNRMNQVRDAIDAGAGAGLWRIYDGSRPATCGTATTLLAEMTCSDPCAAGASGGVMTFSAITADASANATGTATWARLVDSTGTCAVDMNVGTSGSDLNLNSTSISTGQEVSITSAVITEGNA